MTIVLVLEKYNVAAATYAAATTDKLLCRTCRACAAILFYCRYDRRIADADVVAVTRLAPAFMPATTTRIPTKESVQRNVYTSHVCIATQCS